MSTTSGSTYIHLFLFLSIEMEIGGGGGGAVLGISLKLKSVKRVNWEIQNMYYCHKLHIPSSLSVCLSVCLLQKRAMAGRLKNTRLIDWESEERSAPEAMKKGRRDREKEKLKEVEYKTKSGTAWSHSYLNQKPWHPLSYPNQRRKWIAEQTHAERERKAEEVSREVHIRFFYSLLLSSYSSDRVFISAAFLTCFCHFLWHYFYFLDPEVSVCFCEDFSVLS